MRYISVLLFISACVHLQASAFASGGNDARHRIDSIYSLIPGAEGELRLKLYEKTRRLAEEEWSADSMSMLLAEYRMEAHRQNNTEYEVLAIIEELRNLANDGQTDRFMEEIGPALDFAEQAGEWDRYYEMRKLQANHIMHHGRYEEALAVARQTYDLAKSHWHIQGMAAALSVSGRCYQGMDMMAEAESSYKESLELFREVPPGWIGSILFDTFDYYHGVLANDDRYSEALEVCRQWQAQYERYLKEDMSSAVIEFNLAAAFASSYAGLGDADKAEEHLAQMARNPLTKLDLGLNFLRHTMSKVRYSQKRYSESLAIMDTMQREMTAMGDMRGVVGILSDKAFVAYGGGLYRQAADAYKGWKELSDSLRSADNAEALNVLRTEYEVDKLEAQKRARENYLWLAGGIIALLAGLLAVWMVYASRIRRKNLSLYRRIQEMLQNEKQAGQALSAAAEEELSRGMLLFRRVGEWMKTEKPFTDPDLNRKAIADRLGTNETYMADAIREATGLTVSAYIAQLRLKYSLELLGGDPALTLDAVAVDSGHGSYSAFYRMFTRQYGISPSEYRRLSKVKEEVG